MIIKYDIMKNMQELQKRLANLREEFLKAYEKLDIAPCRQFGSIQTDDLVIAGHNYRRHFKYLYKLEAGDSVYLTNAAGTVIEYVVAKNRTLKATEVDTVQNSEYDLVLYTCTYTGTERVAVFCERKDNNGVEIENR
mgnify:CR=1 FL=1